MIENKTQKSNELDKIEKEIKLLESPESQRALAVLGIMCPNNETHNTLRKNQIKKKKLEEFEQLSTKYPISSFHKKEDIIKECIKFDMILVPSTQYQGKMGIEFVNKIDSFCKENNLIVADYSYGEKIYFLLPRVSPAYEERQQDDKYSYARGHLYHKNVEKPLTFFKVEGEENYFLLIDGDKSYKSLGQLVKGYIMYTQHTMRTFWTAVSFAFFNILLASLVFTSDMLTYLPWVMLVPSILVGVIVTGMVKPGDVTRNPVLNQFNAYFYNKKQKGMFAQSAFLVSICLILGIFGSRAITNYKMSLKGNLYRDYESKREIYEKEATEAGLVYNLSKAMYKKESGVIKYEPGVIFPVKTKQPTKTQYILE